MELSENGLNLIKSFEGCKLKAYKCLPNEKYYTIGYGHYGSDVSKNMVISQQEADTLLKKDCERFVNHVNTYVKKYNFNQNQFDALVSFAFNIGNINQLTANGTRSISTISNKILEYNKSGGKVVQGLVSRRKKEKELFDKKVDVCYTTNKLHKVGENVVVSSYYCSSTDPIEKAIIKYKTATIGKVLDKDVHNPYRLDNNGIAIGWCNDGDIRQVL